MKLIANVPNNTFSLMQIVVQRRSSVEKNPGETKGPSQSCPAIDPTILKLQKF